jgi:hypothetical protein
MTALFQPHRGLRRRAIPLGPRARIAQEVDPGATASFTKAEPVRLTRRV